MLDFFRSEIARVVASYPAFDGDRLARVAAGLDEPVLASGRSYLPETLLGHATASVTALQVLLAVFGLMVATGLACLYREWRAGRRLPHPFANIAMQVQLFAALLAGAMGIVNHAAATWHASVGYILTESRAIAVAADGTRVDVPAAAIVAVVRSPDRTRTVIRSTAAADIVIETPADGRAAIDDALGRLASTDTRPLMADAAKRG